MALDDLDDRFGSAVKLALDGLRRGGDDESHADDGAGCPSADVIACYYENTLNRVERSRLETHFSDCARCQGTLAALLRAAPTIEPAPATGRFGAAAARRMAAGSGGARERWFEIGPAWRIAGTAAVVAVAVVGGLHLYQERRGQESEPMVSFSATAQHHHHESHLPSSTNQLALNDNKSLRPTAPEAPKATAAPSAAVAEAPTGNTYSLFSRTSPGVSSTASSAAVPPVSSGEAMARPSTSAGPAAPPQEALPPVAPANAMQNEAATVAAVQAAAALGALAVTPAPAATVASSIATPAAAAAAPATGASGAGIATATPVSETAMPAATAAAPGAVNPKKQELAAPASQTARVENSGQSGSVGGPAATAGASALSAGQPTHDQLVKEQSSKKRRAAELALKTELAKLDAEMKRLMDRAAQREAQAKAAKAAAAKAAAAEAAAAKAQAAETPAAIASARLPAEAPLHVQMAAAPSSAPPPPAAPTPAAAPGAGNEVAMAEPPVVRAPVVATNARGIPVAPHALLISSADHSVFWSLQNSGTVYRSTDRKSWTPEATGIAAELLAGMAPSNTVCWAVGRKGVILLTTDGIHWERVNSPTSSDVIGITAASSDVATIFTASGVSYSTFDGGSNWEPAN